MKFVATAAFAMHFWSFAFALFTLPGALIGWLLRRYIGRKLVAALFAEAFVLMVCADSILKEGFRGASESFAWPHFLLLVPALMAVFTGFFAPILFKTLFQNSTRQKST